MSVKHGNIETFIDRTVSYILEIHEYLQLKKNIKCERFYNLYALRILCHPINDNLNIHYNYSVVRLIVYTLQYYSKLQKLHASL